jgi:cyclic pyranopterin phosphate synthase
MKDSFGREINYMRISVTDRCNMRCKYCMPAEGVRDLGHDNILSFDEIARVVEAAVALGVTKYRLTGGEPLVRKDVVRLVERLAGIEGVKELVMTTNGTLLAQHAKALKQAGLQRINISVDSLDPHKYEEITRGGSLEAAFAGVDAALKYGLTPLKLNVVVIKDFNDDEVLNFVQLAISHPIHVRFIELMPVGRVAGDNGCRHLSAAAIKEKLPDLIPLNRREGVAELYQYPGARGSVGFISPMSDLFCGGCNKIRLTADGKLKPCLHTDEEIDLRSILRTGDADRLAEAIRGAILRKGQRHLLNDGAQPVERGMSQIGG